jgi:anti-sigma-K factor RskA
VDIKAYIESGILESYVLGLTSAEEAAEVQMLCTQHTEIKNAVDEFSLLIEKAAFDNAVTPSAMVKNKVMSALTDEFSAEATSVTPIVPLPAADAANIRPISGLKYFAVAALVLLFVSTILNFYFYNSYRSANNRYEALLTERNSLQANNDAFRTRLNGLEESMRIMQNPDVKMITLSGIKGKENNLAAVYWDSKTKDVYFMPTRMDATPPGKQYQLWAIVDGKPVDAGVIGNCDGLCKMKNIPDAQAFAITLEEKGGSATPTLSAMYVMGKV